MKILKIISIMSFLFISGIDQVGMPIFVAIPYSMIVFFQGLQYPDAGTLISSFLVMLLVPILIIFYRCKLYKDKYILLSCFIALLVAIVFLTGLSDLNNYYHRGLPLYFIIPTSIFIISSVWLIILNFKKPEIKQEE